VSINIRDYVSDDHIESISEIATGQAKIIQALSLDNSQKDKEIERLQDMDKILRNENINLKLRINKAIDYIESYMPNYDFDKTNLMKLLEILKGSDKEWVMKN